MYGATVANLNVFMKQVGKPESLVWNLNGSQVHLISKYSLDGKCSLSYTIRAGKCNSHLLKLTHFSVTGQCLEKSRSNNNQQNQLSNDF